jgi:hypothetical protein
VTINKGERTELRSIVRQQFKVLRHEVQQRGVELCADLLHEVNEKYSDEDDAWGRASSDAHAAMLEANEKINRLYKELLGDKHVERMYVGARLPMQPIKHRRLLEGEGRKRVEAHVQGAMLKLDRDEADLLRNLAIGALESDEARAFLTAIPSVGELVPAARLEELEAALGTIDEPTEDDGRGW